MAESYTFKVFSGPHNGLVFDLKSGSYKVGNSSDDDLIFSDEEMGGTAAVLEITPLDVFITVNQPSSLNGEALEAGRHKWESGSFIKLGDTLISYRASTIRGAWAQPNFNQKTEDSPAENPEETEGAAQEPAEAQKTEAEATEKAAVSTLSPEEINRENLEIKTKLAATLIGAVVMLLLIIALMFGSTFFASDPKQEDLTALNKALSENKFTLLKTELMDDYIDLKGSVESKKRFAKLMDILPKLNTTLNMKVEVRDDEILGIERDFTSLGFNIRAHYIDDGKIGVDGYMFDPYVQAEAFNAMENRYQKKLKGRIVYKSQIEEVLRENCHRLGLNNVQLVMTKGYVFYKGKTTLEDENALEMARYQTAKTLNIPFTFTKYDPRQNSSVERLDGTAVIDLENSEAAANKESDAAITLSSTKEAAPKDDSSIQSVTMKPLPFITLKNGRKYFEGGVLPSGYTVTSIDLNKVVITKDNDVKELQLK